METSVCRNCDNEYKFYRSIPKKSCSQKCTSELRVKDNWIKYKCECKECGIEFMPPRPSDGAIFCSYKCRGINQRGGLVERNGYWYRFVEGHPNASKQGYAPEHHLVVEAHNGEFIPDGFIVHHINHNKKDNRLENLIVMSDHDHKSYHISEQNARGKMNSQRQRGQARDRMIEYNKNHKDKNRGSDGRFE